MKQRVQHPEVHERKDRGTWYWFFRYYEDVVQPDGSVKTSRRFHTIGPSRDKKNPISRQQARDKRDQFFAERRMASAGILVGAPPESRPAAVVQDRERMKAPEPGDIKIGPSPTSGAKITSIIPRSNWRSLHATSTTTGWITTSCRSGRTRASRNSTIARRSWTGCRRNARPGT